MLTAKDDSKAHFNALLLNEEENEYFDEMEMSVADPMLLLRAPHGLDMLLNAAERVDPYSSAANTSTSFSANESSSRMQRSSSSGNLKKVAVACTNCKKAHVACDLERPCRRCHQLDKECIDTMHKKRGRPPNLAKAKQLAAATLAAASSAASNMTMNASSSQAMPRGPTTIILQAPKQLKPSTLQPKINIYLDLKGTIAKAGSEVYRLFGIDAIHLVGRHNLLDFLPSARDRAWISALLARFRMQTSGLTSSEEDEANVGGRKNQCVVAQRDGSRILAQVHISLCTIIECRRDDNTASTNKYAFLCFQPMHGVKKE